MRSRHVETVGFVLFAILSVALLLLTVARANMLLVPTSTGSSTIAFVNWAIPTLTNNANPVFTYTYTTTANTNEMLVIQSWVSPQITSDSQFSATYNSLPCSDTSTTHDNPNSQDTIILAFCPLGTSDASAHNLVVTLAFSLTILHTAVAEYSGVAQSSYLDGMGAAGATSPVSPSLTTTATGDWLVGVAQSRNGAITASSAVSNRGSDFGSTDGNAQYADSAGTVTVGSHTGTFTSGSGDMAAVMVALKHH